MIASAEISLFTGQNPVEPASLGLSLLVYIDARMNQSLWERMGLIARTKVTGVEAAVRGFCVTCHSKLIGVLLRATSGAGDGVLVFGHFAGALLAGVLGGVHGRVRSAQETVSGCAAIRVEGDPETGRALQ